MVRFLLFLFCAMPGAAAEPEFAPLPKAVTSFGAAVSNGYVYVYGGHAGKPHGYSNETTLGQFIRLDLAKPAKWEELVPGPIVQGLALVAHDGAIYRIGGMQPRNKAADKTDAFSIASVARFDAKRLKWEDLPSLPEGRSSHDAVVVGDKIFVAGGWKMNGASKDSEWFTKGLVLDLKQQPLKWESFEQPFKRRALTMAAYNDKVYVIAGLNSDGGIESHVDIYDPDKKLWSKGPDIPKAGMNGFTPAACVVDGKLYLSPADGKLYRLDQAGKAWDEDGALEQARIVHRVVPIGKGRMLAIGGSSKGSPSASVEVVVPKK